MREEARFEYTVRACDCEDVRELENILNEMSLEGWELYSLNEVETQEGEFQYLCIFNREIDPDYEFEDDYIVDSGDFKARMKKLLHKKEDLYEECRFLQRQLAEESQKIKQIKQQLDSNPDEESRKNLNKELSDKINELNTIKSKFSEILSPLNMYNRIGQDLLSIAVSYEHSELIDNEKDGDLIAESVRLRQKLTDKWGYVIPRIHFAVSDEMNENEYRIKVRNLNTVSGVAYPKHKRFFIGESNIENIPQEAIEDVDPITGRQVFWLSEDKTRDFWESGMTPSQVIASHMEFVVFKYVDDILSYEDVLNYITLLEEDKAFLADDLIHSAISLGDLRQVFSGLIREKVAVKDISFIFEKLNDLSGSSYDNETLLKELRILLSKQICSQIADSDNIIYAITLLKQYKKLLFDSLKGNNNKNFFKSSDELDKFVKYISDSILNNEYDAPTIAIIADPEIRKPLFKLFEQMPQDIAVISEDEVSEEFSIQEI